MRTKKKSTRGGRRNGAGRKPKYGDGVRCRPLSCSIPEPLWDRLDQWCRQQNLGRSEVTAEAIKRLLEDQE